MHHYLGTEGTPPRELYAAGRAEIEQYGAQERPGRVVTATPWTGRGRLRPDPRGRVVRLGARLLITAGAVDELPDVPGLAPRWGRDVLHCPYCPYCAYCHDWEVRDQAIGVLATTWLAARQALLFRQLSDDVTVFLHGGSAVSQTDLTRLAARGVRVVPDRVVQVVVAGDRLRGLRLESGEVVARGALIVAHVAARSELVAALGLDEVPVEMNALVVGTAVPAAAGGRTSVAGVWAAGNVTPMAQVIASAAAGPNAGAMINMDLVEQETADAVARMQEAS
ncbi:MAG: thioredoxin reductase [Nocardioides sp.]|nr:thioredoxin reductase [Nocardioides sp.]